jgi:DNA polymerase-3 subunit gamma/tau
MSYQVLARKWRPQLFEDVVGQGHITRTLQNAIATNRLAHAFLFSGPRGVGKTTTARILAKALNCTEGPTPTPCGKCSSCLETAAGSSVDVIEIDGASNRGIEHIRELREAVRYAPVGGKYKVYVIDEVHMLTNEAFNALLKTLEEPPPHVIFIFATTEPQKIPATIHSRCQRYGFKRISLNEIIAKLREIAGKEGIAISDQGLGMIARAAEGSMRDSQSLLDQAVSYSGLAIKDEDLQIILGTVPQDLLAAFTGGLLARDSAVLLKQVDALLEKGQDMRQFLSGVVEQVRNLIVAKTAADPARIIELPAADVEIIKKQAANADAEQLLMLFDSLSRTLEEMRWSPHQRFTLEVGLIKACSLAPLKPLAEVLEQMNELESKLGFSAPGGHGAVAQAGTVREKPAGYSSSKTTAYHAPAAPHLGTEAAQGDPWNRIVHAVKEKKPGLASVLSHGRLLDSTGDNLVVGIKGTSFQMDQVEKKENKGLIEQAAAEVLGRKTSLKFQLLADEAKQGTKKGPASKKPGPEPPDPAVQDVLKVFGGEVIEQDGSEA